MCGGSRPAVRPALPIGGLSPRVRGKPPGVSFSSTVERSIPACAGEAMMSRMMSVAIAVYPRVCGGSPCGTGTRRRNSGLSPRVRGKLGCQREPAGQRRSIPACAGEALPSSSRTASTPVYPRVCGGSRKRTYTLRQVRGLSPRVRGKPDWWIASAQHRRSIPACAGEAWGEFMPSI